MARKTLQLEDIPGYEVIDGKGYIRVCFRNAQNQKRKKYKRVDTVEQALQIKEELRRTLVERGPGAWDGEKMKWEDLLAEYRAQDSKTREWYYKPLEWFNGRHIRAITYGDCKRFKEHRESIPKRYTLNEPRTPASIHREMEILRKVLLFGCQHGWLLRNPMRDGRPLINASVEEKRERIPTPTEQEALLAVCVEPRAHLRPYIVATLDTGLRRSALQGLTWAHVDWESRLLKVPRPVSKYKGRPKLVGISDRFYAELRGVHAEQTLKNDGIWPPGSAKIFRDVKDFKRAYKTACKLAGIEGLRFNDLRHGYATELLEAGIPTDLAMHAAGHKNRDIHDIYTNIDARLALEIAEKLDRLREQRAIRSDLIQ
jgi:integrase